MYCYNTEWTEVKEVNIVRGGGDVYEASHEQPIMNGWWSMVTHNGCLGVMGGPDCVAGSHA